MREGPNTFNMIGPRVLPKTPKAISPGIVDLSHYPSHKRRITLPMVNKTALKLAPGNPFFQPLDIKHFLDSTSKCNNRIMIKEYLIRCSKGKTLSWPIVGLWPKRLCKPFRYQNTCKKQKTLQEATGALWRATNSCFRRKLNVQVLLCRPLEFTPPPWSALRIMKPLNHSHEMLVELASCH